MYISNLKILFFECSWRTDLHSQLDHWRADSLFVFATAAAAAAPAGLWNAENGSSATDKRPDQGPANIRGESFGPAIDWQTQTQLVCLSIRLLLLAQQFITD